VSDRTEPSTGPTWTVLGERVVDDSRRGRLSVVGIELPDGTTFEQYVLRLPAAAIVVVLRESAVLMMWRHRFVLDRWVWELPGGYLDASEDAAAAAVREVEEETGWRPGPVERLLAFQPMVSTINSENVVFLARGATRVASSGDVNEAAQVAWIPLVEVREMIYRGEIVGSSSVVGLLAAMDRLASF
jgi:8-oxo-dGTP pyrophosphatase MutT (NUDIX family)